jgi:L-ascorbate metabolism protein UlaG (beta-lactamase superfamily)
MKDSIAEKIQWLGHDAFRISGSRTIYIDPYQINPPQPRADLILCTHAHFDHCSPEDIKLIRDEKTLLIGTADTLASFSGNKREVSAGDRFAIGEVRIEVVPAYNLNKTFHPRDSRWVGYVITIDGVRIYHAGDTDRIPEMKDIKADIALLPVSGTYVMTAEEAADAALDIGPRVAMPMHYGSVVGSEDDAQRFSRLLAGKIDVVVKKKT